MNTEELIRQLKTREFAIFGTGFVAEMFYAALERLGLSSRFGFAVVSVPGADRRFHGKPVRAFCEATFPEDMLLCVAVHESVMLERKDIFAGNSVQAVWIYPNLFELLYGPPVRTSDSLPLQEVLSLQSREEYWLAVRFAAIRDYLRNDDGYCMTRELYRRALSLHCSYETAVLREKQMEALASSMASEGFRQDCPVRIEETGRILDGLHRIACAAFLKIEKIPAVVHRASPFYDRLLGARNRLPEQLLQDAGFSGEELRRLREARDTLLNGR